MEWHETDYPDWQDAGKQVEMDGGPTGTLVIVDQTPGPYETPLWGIEVGGKIERFDYLKCWRFAVPNASGKGPAESRSRLTKELDHK